ncbi:hypothetical protein [Clostridioides sp. ES-S-0048-02]|uniref:hypothetical protein n=1 Tax=Clostridioides sp. ES-S-0048-02 TaxID=2770777 RepID=UPI001D130103|nr:hypothetical protein [Clostridioides sp. ES-S-0048-02]
MKNKKTTIFKSYFNLFNIIYDKLSLNGRKQFESYTEQKNIIHSLEFDFQYKEGYKNFIKLYMTSRFDILENFNRFSSISIENFRIKNSKYLEAVKELSKIDIDAFLSEIDIEILNEYIRLEDELNNLIIEYLFLKGHIDCIDLAIILDMPIDQDNKYIKAFYLR